MTAPEVSLERYIREKRSRGELMYSHIIGRVAVEDLPPDHLYRSLVNWMNQQLSDIGINSTGGYALSPLHFDLVEVNDNKARAHVFETEEFGFIVVTQPMVDEMKVLSSCLVDQNPIFMNLQIAPLAISEDIVHLLLLMQFCFVTSHEWSHLARRHLEDLQHDEADISEYLGQTQELDGIRHFLRPGILLQRRRQANRVAVVEDFKRESIGKVHPFMLSPVNHDSVLRSLGGEDSHRSRCSHGTSTVAFAHRVFDAICRNVVSGS